MEKMKQCCCRDCKFLTNVLEKELDNDNVMGGCFIDGHITFTDTKACNNNFKKKKI